MSLYRTTDQMGEIISFNFPPRRIVSLVPSQTELLFALGAGNAVAGITKFCIHPKDLVKTKTIVGGTKAFDLDVIDHIKPDLIIGNKEENYREGIKRLREKYPVWMSDVYTLHDAMEMIVKVGEITDTSIRGRTIANNIEHGFKTLTPFDEKRVLYLIWRKPWMAAGPRTFIDDILKRVGFKNVVEEERYPTLSPDWMRNVNPDVVLLSSEPFPFNATHMEELRQIMPHSEFHLVDGEMFSWYGSRLQYACDYFKSLPFYRV